MTFKPAAALSVALILLSSACASHRITAATPEPTPIRHTVDQTSFFGRQGASTHSTAYVTREECRNGDLVEVEVRRNVLQGLVTVLTLGTISPATIEFTCAKPPVPPPVPDADPDDTGI